MPKKHTNLDIGMFTILKDIQYYWIVVKTVGYYLLSLLSILIFTHIFTTVVYSLFIAGVFVTETTWHYAPVYINLYLYVSMTTYRCKNFDFPLAGA